MVRYPPTPEPVRIELEPTNACNAKCIFCPRHKMIREIGYMNLDNLRRFLDELLNYRANMWLNRHHYNKTFPRLVFCGLGEPLLHSRISEMVSEASIRGFETEVVTNGSLLEPKVVSDLIRAGLDNLAISLHSINPEMYRSLTGLEIGDILPKVQLTLQQLRNSDVTAEIWRVSGQSNTVPENRISDDSDFSRFMDSHKEVKVLGPTPAWNRGGLLERTVWPLANDGNRIWCEKLYLTATITWDGMAILCCCDYFKETVILGNAWQEPFKILQSRRNGVFRQTERPTICKVCRRPRESIFEKEVMRNAEKKVKHTTSQRKWEMQANEIHGHS